MLQLLTFTTLVQRWASAAMAQAGTVLDFSVGTVDLALAQAAASIALWLQWLIVLVLQKIRAATASGADLDSWMADFGITRLAATYATGTVTFSRFTPTASALVPVGALLKTVGGTQSFMVVADSTQAYWNAALNGYLIPGSVASGNATVAAVTAGTAGNVQAGTISLIASTIAGVDTVNNAVAFTNALAAETDAALRVRFQAFFTTLAKATTAAVYYAISAVQQGLYAVIAENVSSTGVYQPGNFVVTVDDGSGHPPAALLTSLQAAVNAVRPIGSTFYLSGPTVSSVAVVMTITAGSVANKAVMQPLAQAAITAYLNTLPPGAGLAYSQIIRVAYGVDPSITNVSACTVNSGTADLSAVPGTSYKPGTVTVN